MATVQVILGTFEINLERCNDSHRMTCTLPLHLQRSMFGLVVETKTLVLDGSYVLLNLDKPRLSCAYFSHTCQLYMIVAQHKGHSPSFVPKILEK